VRGTHLRPSHLVAYDPRVPGSPRKLQERACVLVCVGLVGLLGACRREAPRLSLDLAEEAARAEWCFPGGLTVRMTPTLEVHPHRRLPRPPRLEARLFFRGRWPQDKRLQLGLEAIGGPADWTASVSVAGGPPTSLSLKPGRHWSIVELPPGVRRARVLVVSAAMPSENAWFFIRDLAFVPTGAPLSLEPVPLEPVPRLVQSGPSEVRFAALLPPRPVLRFTPSAAGATEPVRFRVSFEGMDAESRDLWSATVAPGSSRAGEVTLRLPEVGREPVRIGLHVDGTSPGPRGVWLAPRILGQGKGPSLRPRPYASTANSLADPLREQLKGVNVLVVLMDAARASHLGCYGYDRPTTPEIDRLAREGVVFERAYAPAPFTVASVSSLWTSLYPDAASSPTRAVELPLASHVGSESSITSTKPAATGRFRFHGHRSFDPGCVAGSSR